MRIPGFSANAPASLIPLAGEANAKGVRDFKLGGAADRATQHQNALGTQARQRSLNESAESLLRIARNMRWHGSCWFSAADSALSEMLGSAASPAQLPWQLGFMSRRSSAWGCMSCPSAHPCTSARQQ